MRGPVCLQLGRRSCSFSPDVYVLFEEMRGRNTFGIRRVLPLFPTQMIFARSTTMAVTLRRARRCLFFSRQVVQPIERVLASRGDIKVGLVLERAAANSWGAWLVCYMRLAFQPACALFERPPWRVLFFDRLAYQLQPTSYIDNMAAAQVQLWTATRRGPLI